LSRTSEVSRVFSVVNGVLLRPLPFPHPEELVALHESKMNFPSGSISYPNFRDWQRLNHTFAAMAIMRSAGFTLTGRGEAEHIRAGLVTSDVFRLLGVQPLAGRTFAPGEDEIGAAPGPRCGRSNRHRASHRVRARRNP
jgi:hypothetical protein